MKDRIVIWGQDEKDTDVLIAIRLLQNSDIIKIWTFPKKGIDETFVDALFKDWKDGAEDNFPQPFTLIERGITEENMLPEGIKTPKTDVIKIAEQEWRVRVLSFRLYEHIKQQIEQLKVRVSNLSVYSKDVWEEAKDVSRSIKENTLDRNIKREQTTELRKGIDEVFDQMKKLQNAEQAKYLEASKNNMVAIRTKVSEVLEKIGTERHTKKLWDKLLAYQQEAKGQEMTPRDRNALRLNFNEAFSALKADIQSNVGNRLNSRINGLKGAIEKMETSIKRDKDNIAYQSGRINKNSTTQLEYQLRSAKLKLIEDRIQSKEQKLHNMYLTLKDLEKKSVKLPKAKKVDIKAKKKVEASASTVVVKNAESTKEDTSNVTTEQKVAEDVAKQNDEASSSNTVVENEEATTQKDADADKASNTETAKTEASPEKVNNVASEQKSSSTTVVENTVATTQKDVDLDKASNTETAKTEVSPEKVDNVALEQKAADNLAKQNDTTSTSAAVVENAEATAQKDAEKASIKHQNKNR